MRSIILAAVLVSIAPTAQAVITVDQIIQQANEAAYYAGDDGRAQVEMRIVDKNGGERTRKFTLLRLNTKNGNQKFYVYFKEPADLYKQVFMVCKEVAQGKSDQRWIWLPALNLKRSIAPGDKRISFVGSDFVYEDVSGRNLNDDSHELIETTESQYVVKNTPIDPKSVEFSYYTIRIDKDTFLPRRAEYFDHNDKMYRIVEATKIELVQGFPTVIESVVQDLNTGGSTTNIFSEVEYNIGLKENIFTERFLRRPPREVTR